MSIAQRILRIVHPKAEGERMKMREALARATAEAEDVTRTVKLDAEALRKYLAENCTINCHRKVHRQ